MTFSGFMMNGMPRDLGWQFTLLGRHIERISNLCAALTVALHQSHEQSFEWLVDGSDTTIYYRSRYVVAPRCSTVLDMLLCDETHPRSVTFQAHSLIEQLDAIMCAGLSRQARVSRNIFATACAGLQGLKSAALLSLPDSDSDALVQALCARPFTSCLMSSPCTTLRTQLRAA
jgi:uncharacterized alpha-E superfamily protein